MEEIVVGIRYSAIWFISAFRLSATNGENSIAPDTASNVVDIKKVRAKK